jgi:hypothetical protein
MTSVRAVAHVHSEWSFDADWPLPRLAASFRRRGYDVVLMSEHDLGFDQARWTEYADACREASSPDLLLVPGIEYADQDNAVHLPVWGDVPFLGSGHCGLPLLRAAHEAGGFAVFAHPHRREAWRRFDPSWVPYLGAVETWNRKYDGWAPNRSAVHLADDTGVDAFVSLDFHTRRQFFPLSMVLEVEGAVDRAGVEAALTAGAFRPTMGRMAAERFSHGVPGAAAQGCERARRRLARFTHGRAAR